MTMETIARLDDVVHSHDGRRAALDRCSFDVPRGRTTALVGANGSGKSTALALLAGTASPRSGRVVVRSRRPAALVVQRSAVDDRLPLTVRDTVAMGRWADLGWWRRPRAADRLVVEGLLGELGLLDVAERRLGDVSGGQRQRALVAQGLAQRSDLLLLDEPTTGVDLATRDRIGDAVAAARAAGTTVVLATHDVDLAAACDHVVTLEDGVARP
ncbi:zinc ABC transporter ATP-binding protein AztA [Solicola sp. PLA-1-18]|uniref:zinc ABC transporter ATP-binding protein AztA n=1 Tax=Solicola sp. PLA-1-18 TaxID=3380532 RepID=UPI003B7A6C57